MKYVHVCMLSASAKCEILQDLGDRDVRRLLRAGFDDPGLGTYHVSHVLFLISCFVYFNLISVRRRQTNSMTLQQGYDRTFRITSSPIRASTFYTNTISQIVTVTFNS
jgi:hypothetical protein